MVLEPPGNRRHCWLAWRHTKCSVGSPSPPPTRGAEADELWIAYRSEASLHTSCGAARGKLCWSELRHHLSLAQRAGICPRRHPKEPDVCVPLAPVPPQIVISEPIHAAVIALPMGSQSGTSTDADESSAIKAPPPGQ